MRNLVEFPIRPDEVIDYLQRVVKREQQFKRMNEFTVGDMDALLAATALEVVRTAANVPGSKELYEAFNSQNIKS